MRLVGHISQLSEHRCVLDITAGHIDNDLVSQEVVVEVNKHKQKRSLSANAYFWVLVDQIARKLGTDKESIYIWMIRDAGVFVPLTVIEDAIPTLQKSFRYIEQVGQSGEYVDVLCFMGTSTYDTKEMAHIIDVTRQEAIKLGCDVWTEEEIKRLFDESKYVERS